MSDSGLRFKSNFKPSDTSSPSKGKPTAHELAKIDGKLSTQEVADSADVSYRQLNFWVDKGWITPDSTNPSPGSGYRRRWSQEEAAAVRELAARIQQMENLREALWESFRNGSLWAEVTTQPKESGS